MGRKIGLTLDRVVAAAAEIADSAGLDALSLASVASALGVRSPSRYNHVDGLAGAAHRGLTRGGSGSVQSLVMWLRWVFVAAIVVVSSWAVMIVLARRLPPGLAKDLATVLPACAST